MAKSQAHDTRKQLLHLVFGGELKDLQGVEFVNLDELDIVGMYAIMLPPMMPGRGPRNAR